MVAFLELVIGVAIGLIITWKYPHLPSEIEKFSNSIIDKTSTEPRETKQQGEKEWETKNSDKDY